jgi:hypothetical protein
MVLFFGPEDPFSTWYPSQFHYQAMPFENVQHFVNYFKAKMFGDEALAERIYKAKNPQLCQQLGREVKGFNQEKWNAEREKYVQIGCREKFLQNTELLIALFETGDRLLVEANPKDAYWGIGFAEDDPQATMMCYWPGRHDSRNRLGHIITTFRDWLMDGYDEGTLPRRARWAVEDMLRYVTARKAG